MSNSAKVWIIIGIVLVVLALLLIPTWISTHNKDVGLRNLAAGKQDECKMVFDETWKIISQKAQVADQYKDAFQESFAAIMEGRYGNARGGSMMSWIHEQNPNFDASMYKSIQASIEAQRHKYTEAQKMLRDIKVQHDDLRTRFPTSLFCSNDELKVTIVTSLKTKEVYKAGEENDIDIFDKEK